MSLHLESGEKTGKLSVAAKHELIRGCMRQKSQACQTWRLGEMIVTGSHGIIREFELSLAPWSVRHWESCGSRDSQSANLENLKGPFAADCLMASMPSRRIPKA